MSDEELTSIAQQAGLRFESWLTSPPSQAMWHGTPEQLKAFASAVKTRALASISPQVDSRPRDVAWIQIDKV